MTLLPPKKNQEECKHIIEDSLESLEKIIKNRGEDISSRLDLLFTKGINLEKDISYECPLGRSDHVILEIDIK